MDGALDPSLWAPSTVPAPDNPWDPAFAPGPDPNGGYPGVSGGPYLGDVGSWFADAGNAISAPFSALGSAISSSLVWILVILAIVTLALIFVSVAVISK